MMWKGIDRVEELIMGWREHREKRSLKGWLVTGLWVKKTWKQANAQTRQRTKLSVLGG